MNLITLENVGKQYSERKLFEQATILINSEDRIGFIGINGSGKTTLLRILAGLESPDTGKVTIWGGVRVQYLPQDPQLNDELTVLEQLLDADAPQIRLLRDYEAVSARLHQSPEDEALQKRFADLTHQMDQMGGWAAEANMKAILTRLGITDFSQTVRTLSGGLYKRVALARALIAPTDLLILDEPTNHIDADTIAWLEEYLVSLPCALLMVTHDRYFLQRVANRIVEIERRQLVSYAGNYNRYLELKAERQEKLANVEGKRQTLLRRELAWAHRGAIARGTKQKARLDRVQELLEAVPDRANRKIALALTSQRLGKKVLKASGLSKAFGPLPLFKQIDFELGQGDRVGIIGPNGVGKSTLLDILAGLIPADGGVIEWGETAVIGYYDQHSHHMDDNLKVIDFIARETPVIRTKEGEEIEAAQMLEWFLFSRAQQQTQIGSLSGGEKRRLYLLNVLAHRPNVLFLDEPTNDLDIETLTVLEEFLDEFPGSVVIVSHDRYFLDRTVDFLAVLEDGRFSPRYPTPYATYQALRAQNELQNAPIVLSKTAVPPTPAAKPADRPRKLSWKEQRELEELNGRIERLEAEKEQCQTNLQSAGGDYQRLQQLSDQISQLDQELESILERWLELSERAD